MKFRHLIELKDDSQVKHMFTLELTSEKFE